MKKLNKKPKGFTKKSKGVTKGAPSGFVISLLVHAGALLLAGLLVVFNVVNREEKKFVPPPPVERPKMKLKKPKPRVKKSSKPKSVSRIVTKVQKADMPDIQLPELSGMGDSLAGGLGSGFDLMPDLGEVTLFGGGMSIGNDFVGTFYDFKRDRTGRNRIMDTGTFEDAVAAFVRSGFRSTKLAKYYRSPKQLYATSFMVPTVKSSVAPRAFGEDTGGWTWMVHYKGQLVHKDGIKFRFWGQGDDILIVAVDGKVVLNGSWPGTQEIYSNWNDRHAKSRTYIMGNNLAVVGDWITLEPGVPVDMEVIGGEIPGGEFDMMLVVEEEGVDYPVNNQGGPILPMFKTAYPDHDLCDQIYQTLVEGEAGVTNGPIFSDFIPKGASLPEEADVLPEPVEEDTLRTWTLADGKTVEAEYVAIMGGQVVLKSPKGKQVKLDPSQLSEADQDYIEFANPPEFNITFTKQSSTWDIPTTPYMEEVSPTFFDWTFGVKLKQTSAAQYNREVFVEFFAIGQQLLDNDKFILLDRQITSFIPTRENQRSHVFRSPKKVEIVHSLLNDQKFGEKIKGNLVLVRDERGKIIQYSASSDWLYEKREELMKVPVGRFFDETCRRVYPTGPKANY